MDDTNRPQLPVMRPAAQALTSVFDLQKHCEDCQICAPERLHFCEEGARHALQLGTRLDDAIDQFKRHLVTGLLKRLARRA